jgi:glycosyltransferase involved in cell wall biosynthesis
MKFRYFLGYVGGNQSGVLKKCISQTDNLRKLGLDAELITVTTPRSTKLDPAFIKNTVLNKDIDGRSLISKLGRENEVLKVLERTISSLNLGDILYLRYPYPVFFTMLHFARRFGACKVITEHNSIDPVEFKLSKDHIQYYSDSIFGDRVRGLSDGIVGVTEEITQYQLKRSRNQQLPHITIGNGIDVGSVKLRSPPDLGAGSLDLLCVANVNRWHGVDRIIEGINEYKGTAKVRLHVVGDGSELARLKDQTASFGLDDAIIFHGFLSGKSLDNLFDKCHLAVGTLGIHRLGMRQASVLKAREYCARGIPFIYGIEDPDFSRKFDYLLKVPDTDVPIDIDSVIDFAHCVYKDPSHHRRMRDFAGNYLDWSIKMRRLNEFCRSLI